MKAMGAMKAMKALSAKTGDYHPFFSTSFVSIEDELL
jgi:hypothetical protein